MIKREGWARITTRKGRRETELNAQAIIWKRNLSFIVPPLLGDWAPPECMWPPCCHNMCELSTKLPMSKVTLFSAKNQVICSALRLSICNLQCSCAFMQAPGAQSPAACTPPRPEPGQGQPSPSYAVQHEGRPPCIEAAWPACAEACVSTQTAVSLNITPHRSSHRFSYLMHKTTSQFE